MKHQSSFQFKAPRNPAMEVALKHALSTHKVARAEKCEHEFENNFGNDPRPRYVKAKKPKCKICGEYYESETTV